MLQTSPDAKPFRLDVQFKDPLQNSIFTMVRKPVEHLLAFPRLNEIYADILTTEDHRTFTEKALDRLDISYDLPVEDRARISISDGPVIIIANHPFGGIEGIILASILRAVRPDVKFMANYLLHHVPELRDLVISVDPFKGPHSIARNIRPIRECLDWVRHGGMLVLFPAGAVSHFDARKGAIVDPPWDESIARIVKKTKAPVLPVFFDGTNSAMFHVAGMVHPLLRTAMLPNELLNKKNKTIPMRVGEIIPFEKIREFEDEDLTGYLRLRTYLLEQRVRRTGKGQELNRNFAVLTKQDGKCDIIAPRNPAIMADEILQLEPGRILMETGDLQVIQAEAKQIGHLLLEIGRLREITFRAAGEGTGRSLDLDRYDEIYTHLFIWNRKKREVVGAYRLGKTDELLRKDGVSALYTSTLFRYDEAFFGRLGPALELGRSFVRPEYQKSYAPLLLLWKGIARFISGNPQYKTLFGPVSISCEYEPLSKELMVGYLKANRYRADLAQFVRPRKPLRARLHKKWDIEGIMRMLIANPENLSELVSCIEQDRKGIPVLLKQYLKLGGRVIEFNVDPSFGHVLDGLIMVDLTQSNPAVLERYFGKEDMRCFSAYHAAPRAASFLSGLERS